MPCDYKKYPANWKSEIRPAILEREGHRCKTCRAKNKTAIFRGYIVTGGRGKVEVYQTADGKVYDAENGNQLFDGTVYVCIEPLSGNENQKAIKVILTVAHLDHDITNNDYSNLAALCQLHHLRHDISHHKSNSRETNRKKKGLQKLF